MSFAEADTGDDYARSQLGSWLSDRGRAAEAAIVIRPLAEAGDEVVRVWLARWRAPARPPRSRAFLTPRWRD
jgi:hypothetical protein